MRQYPEQRSDPPPAFRGMPVLVANELGASRCVPCGLCEAVCPPQCITVRVAGNATLADFELDMGRCTFCGLCETICPERAIAMSPHFAIAAEDRDSLIFDLPKLLVPAELLKPRLEFLAACDLLVLPGDPADEEEDDSERWHPVGSQVQSAQRMDEEEGEGAEQGDPSGDSRGEDSDQ